MNESNKNKNLTVEKILEDSKENGSFPFLLFFLLVVFMTEEQRKELDKRSNRAT